MKADLHNHSTYSDGNKNIKELVKIAKEKKLDIIAITDHDNLESYFEISNSNFDIIVIPGIELSTIYNSESIHVLGYFKKSSDIKTFKETVDKVSENRKTRIHTIISLLRKHYNLEIDYNDIVSYADGAIGRPHIAHAICDKYNYTFDEVFEKFIGNDKKAYIPVESLNTKDALMLLKDCNILSVLAHPRLIKKNSIKELLELGFDGIEMYYPNQGEKFKKYADKYSLISTGGSDYHGTTHNDEMGISFLEEKELEIFLENISK